MVSYIKDDVVRLFKKTRNKATHSLECLQLGTVAYCGYNCSVNRYDDFSSRA